MRNSVWVLLIITLFLLQIALAQSPELPHLFYGSATVEGAPLLEGATIIAQVDGTEVGRVVTPTDGIYGGPKSSDTKLLVQDAIADGATIGFFLSTIPADQTGSFDSGKVEELDLTWGDFPPEISVDCPLIGIGIYIPDGTTFIINCGDLTLELIGSSAGVATINEVSEEDAGSAPSAVGIGAGATILSVFEIDIEGDVTTTATIGYDPTGLDEGSIKPYKYDGASWIAVTPYSQDAAANTITFDITPGSLFGAIGSPPSGGGAGGVGGTGGGAGAPGAAAGPGTAVGGPTATATTAGPAAAPAAAAAPSPGAAAPASAAPAAAPGITGAATAEAAPTGFAALTGAILGAFKSPVTSILLSLFLLAAIILIVALLVRRKGKGPGKEEVVKI